MKKKHYGLFSISMIIIAMGASLIYLISNSWKMDDNSSGSPGFKPLPLYAEPSTIEMRTIDQLSPRMKTLTNPPARKPVPADLRLLGYVHHGSEKFQSRTKTRVKNSTQPDYLLSFTFSSGRKRFCILNNKFYQEGDQLPEGSQIVRIQTRRVLLDTNGLQYWISINAESVDQTTKQQNAFRTDSMVYKEKK